MPKIIICCERAATARLWQEVLKGTLASQGVIIVTTLPQLESMYDLHINTMEVAFLSWKLAGHMNTGFIARQMIDDGVDVVGVTTTHHLDFREVGVTTILEDASKITQLLGPRGAIRKFLADEIYVGELLKAALE